MLSGRERRGQVGRDEEANAIVGSIFSAVMTVWTMAFCTVSARGGRPVPVNSCHAIGVAPPRQRTQREQRGEHDPMLPNGLSGGSKKVRGGEGGEATKSKTLTLAICGKSLSSKVCHVPQVPSLPHRLGYGTKKRDGCQGEGVHRRRVHRGGSRRGLFPARGLYFTSFFSPKLCFLSATTA